jgi:hypothetical protein
MLNSAGHSLAWFAYSNGSCNQRSIVNETNWHIIVSSKGRQPTIIAHAIARSFGNPSPSAIDESIAPFTHPINANLAGGKRCRYDP